MNSSKNPPLAFPEEEPTIDLRQYLALLGHWWWLIILSALLGAAVGYIISMQIAPIYQASTTLLINEAPSDKTADYTNILTSERLASTYAQMLTKRPVFEKAIARLDITITPEQMSTMVTVIPVRDTQLIDIDVESADPALAASVANALYLVFSEQLQDTQSSRYVASKNSLQSQVTDSENEIASIRKSLQSTTDPSEISRLETRLNQYQQILANLTVSYEQVRMAEAQTLSNVVQVEQAIPPTIPIRPKPLQNTIFAAVIGLMLALGSIFAADALDDTVKSPDEINRVLKLPIMGTIARYEEPSDGNLITRAQPRSPIAESFRALRTNVQYASVDRPLRTLIVTSPAPGDGKTTVTANLATVLAQGGRHVTVVDADLHRPRVHHVFNAESRPGLSSLFIKPSIRLNGSFQSTVTKRLHVIAAGELPPNPSELLGSNKMHDILDAILEQSDLVMFDTPPVLSVTDAVVLAPMVDGVLVVCRPGVTKMNALKYAIEQLRYVGANVVGVILNGIDNKSSRYGYYYKSYNYKQYKYYRTNGKAPKKTASHHSSIATTTPTDPMNFTNSIDPVHPSSPVFSSDIDLDLS
jgi:capsular exopolysaccharide synthesis family protein